MITEGKHSANFFVRLLASILDTFIIGALVLVGFWYAAQSPDLESFISSIFIMAVFIFLPVMLFSGIGYTALLTTYLGGTLGKLICGLKVIDEASNTNLSYKKSLFRHLIGYSFSWTFFGLGFLNILKDPKRQGWHDKAIGSEVIVTKNIWWLGLIALLVLAFVNINLLMNTIGNISYGPVGRQIEEMSEQLETEEKQQEQLKKIKEQQRMRMLPNGQTPTDQQLQMLDQMLRDATASGNYSI